MSGENSALLWMPALGGLAVKSLLVFLIAGAALLALRRASASARHLVCLLTLAGLLALPLLSVALPGWRLAVLKGEPTPRQVAAPPETGGGRVLEKGMVSTSSPLRFGEGGEERAGRGSPPVPPAPNSGGAASFPWLPLLLSFWLGGALLSLLRPGLGLWGIGRLSKASEPVLDAPALALTAECAAALGLARTPALRSAGAPVPMTWGWRRPVVLLPEGARDWTAGRLRAVLLHELAHVRRRDWLSHRLADAVCALYWFHPLVWLTARRLRAEGEIACDDLVLTAGVAAPDYARHLLDVARALRPAEAVPCAAIAMARTARIEGRLMMILDKTRPRRAPTRRALLLALTPGAAALVALAVLRLEVRAQAAPVSARPPAAPAPSSDIPQAPGMVTRYFIGPGPRHPSMKQEGAITWSPPRLALLPKALPLGAKLAAGGTLKHLKAAPHEAAPHEAAPRVALLPLAVPTPVTLPAVPDRPAPAPPASAAPTSDVSVDLVGVTDGGRWWDASGALLPQPLYSPTAYHTGKYDYWRKAFDAGKPRLDFAFRVSPASARDVTLRLSLESPGVPWSSTLGTWPEKMQGRDQQTEAQLNSLSGGLRVLSATYNSVPTARPITVSVASGPWTVAATVHVSAAGPSQNFAAHAYFFSQLFETDGKSRVIISTNDTENDIRIVVVDAQGRETLPAEIGDSSTPAMSQMTALFALPAAQIKELRVETRPFRQMSFKDVAAQPAK